VRNVGLRAASDRDVWEYARADAFAIVSKDTDFRERSFVEGFPPKIIWLDVGNAGTAAILALLRTERERIERFGTVEETSLLILSIGRMRCRRPHCPFLALSEPQRAANGSKRRHKAKVTNWRIFRVTRRAPATSGNEQGRAANVSFSASPETTTDIRQEPALRPVED
jgi:predicted nuclease of predicted toxin-antitoxin system